MVQTHGAVHAFVHIVLFACLTGLLAASARSRGRRWLFCIGAILLGFGTEWYEHLKDGFPVETMDVVADCAGAGVAMIATFVPKAFAKPAGRA